MTARGTDQSCSLYPAVSFFAGLGTPFAPPGRNENREGTIFLRSVFHGFRDGPQRSRAAPPAATFRGPVEDPPWRDGAEGKYSPPASPAAEAFMLTRIRRHDKPWRASE
jgi:hypothetical protein